MIYLYYKGLVFYETCFGRFLCMIFYFWIFLILSDEKGWKYLWIQVLKISYVEPEVNVMVRSQGVRLWP